MPSLRPIELTRPRGAFAPSGATRARPQNGARPPSGHGWGRRRGRIAALEALTPGIVLRGLPNATVSVVAAEWAGDNAIELTFKAPDGRVDQQVVFRHDEPRLEVVGAGRPWSFDGDGATFRLVSEANRIRLAHLFDPVLAVHTSEVRPLPHQITAVYQEMLPRQPLRFRAGASCAWRTVTSLDRLPRLQVE